MNNAFENYSLQQLNVAEKHLRDCIWRCRKRGWLPGMQQHLESNLQRIVELKTAKQAV